MLITTIGIGLNLVLATVFTETKLVVDEIQTEQPDLLGKKGAYATNFALMNMSFAAGSLLGPILERILVERVGWGNSTLIFGILCALCVTPSFLRCWREGSKGRKVYRRAGLNYWHRGMNRNLILHTQAFQVMKLLSNPSCGVILRFGIAFSAMSNHP